MAFRQHHRPQQSRQLSYHEPEQPAPLETAPSPQRKRPLEDSEEWVLFSPTAPSTTARTQTTSTERTPRTLGLSRFSDFGSLDTAARSDQDDDNFTCQGTDLEEEGELDSLDDGLHAFHEPSEYSAPSRRLIQSGETVLPTHDGLGTFQADGSTIQEQLWQFERSSPRRRAHQRRRSSVQRRLDALEETEELDHEDNRRLRIEKWRLEQSKALLEEIERETRRRRRMSLVSAARRAQQEVQHSSEDNTENLSFLQRFTRRIIHDLMGIDENILSVIFGESLPLEATPESASIPDTKSVTETVLADIQDTPFSGDPWEHRLLERIARELGVLVHQLSEHPGAFSTYLRTQETPSYAGLSLPPLQTANLENSPLTTTQSSIPSPTAAIFAPTLQKQTTYSDASLWGIEEEEETDLLESFRQHQRPTSTTAEDLVRTQQDREYWERELDVKMVFNYLTTRFSSRPSIPTRRAPLGPRSSSAPADPAGMASELVSARRAALIRQHHPLVSRAAASQQSGNRRRDLLHRHHYLHSHTPAAPSLALRNPVLRSASGNQRTGSSCASQSTKKSKRSGGSGRNRNFWDMSGSVGSGSVVYGEA
ncbi:uncharacterized protein BDZ99DRAFT_391809 [Mytilinidion resinicola]|uniref:Uncharacterized protein n=1 Tax=Mytilinidion resinicola TaxID=574789 RepID=A0A6A6YFN7_9PEZI|nr:uncharacterized protein BDZ99DRAFT_391809 [Mytilinidion resinicola]KAF2807621.1 hypothetical protein BDZ99DRAFT_391809 [Mytilinidion resinicola]